MLIRHRHETAWRVPEVTSYADESAIQQLLAESPDLLPGTGIQRLAVAREVALDTGVVDIVGVAPDGTITVVECKLKANPEIRRHVIGQALAYASSLWGLDYETFDRAFAERNGMALARAVAVIAGDEWDEEGFRAALTAHLAAGRLRLVIAVDAITPELQRIVRFLNSHTTPDLEVLALELRYVADGGVEILVPTVYGQESARKMAGSVSQKWNDERFFAALAACTTGEELAAARDLYQRLIDRGANLQWGVGPLPSVTARLAVLGTPLSVLTLYEWPAGQAKVSVNFEYLIGNVSLEELQRLATTLRLIEGGAARLAGLEVANYKKRPTFPLGLLVSTAARDTLLQAVDALLSPAVPG